MKSLLEDLGISRITSKTIQTTLANSNLANSNLASSNREPRTAKLRKPLNLRSPMPLAKLLSRSANRTKTNSSLLPSSRSWIPWSTHNQAARQAVLEIQQDKPKVPEKVPVQQLKVLDRDPAQVPAQVQDKVLDLAQVPVPEKVPEKAQAKDRAKVPVKAPSQALEKAPEQAQVSLVKTHIPTSFIPEMKQLSTAALSTATAAHITMIWAAVKATTATQPTTTSNIYTVQMDKAEENNPPLSPSLRKVSISIGYKNKRLT